MTFYIITTHVPSKPLLMVYTAKVLQVFKFDHIHDEQNRRCW